MKKELLRWAICLLIFPVLNANAQNTAPVAPAADKNVKVFDNVLKMADLTGFKYKDALERAKSGDAAAIQELLEFHKVVDGVTALNHAVTCLELIPVVGDLIFAGAASHVKTNLKKVILDRLILAQGRTQKVALRKSMTDWAPYTWAYLQEKNMASPVSDAPAEQTAPATDGMMNNADAMAAPSAAPDARATPPSNTLNNAAGARTDDGASNTINSAPAARSAAPAATPNAKPGSVPAPPQGGNVGRKQ